MSLSISSAVSPPAIVVLAQSTVLSVRENTTLRSGDCHGRDLVLVGLITPQRNRRLAAGRGSVRLDRPRRRTQNRSMSSSEIDAYLAGLEEPKRSTLQELRHTILEVIPEAEEGISYQVPAFRLHGKVVAGFAAFKNHLSYLPHSGSVFPQLQQEVASYRTSTGALQFPIDQPLPKPLVEKLVRVRIAQAFPE